MVRHHISDKSIKVPDFDMNLDVASYRMQAALWPRSGRHILAQFNADSIVVYQSYRPAVGHYAARHNAFGGEFSMNREFSASFSITLLFTVSESRSQLRTTD
jgi:hypothetical protein